jgi:hypothetical protein
MKFVIVTPLKVRIFLYNHVHVLRDGAELVG